MFCPELKTNMTLNAEAAEHSGLSKGMPFKLNYLSYTDSVVVKRMFQHLDEIDFLGISVSIIIPITYLSRGRDVISISIFLYLIWFREIQ